MFSIVRLAHGGRSLFSMGTVEDPPSQVASSPSGAQLTKVNMMAHWSHVTQFPMGGGGRAAEGLPKGQMSLQLRLGGMRRKTT